MTGDLFVSAALAFVVAAAVTWGFAHHQGRKRQKFLRDWYGTASRGPRHDFRRRH